MPHPKHHTLKHSFQSYSQSLKYALVCVNIHCMQDVGPDKIHCTKAMNKESKH